MSAHEDAPYRLVAPGEVFALIRDLAEKGPAPTPVVLGLPGFEFEVVHQGRVVDRLVLSQSQLPMYFRCVDGLLDASKVAGIERRPS